MTTQTAVKTDYRVLCDTPGCRKVLAEVATRPYKLWCRHCKTYTQRLN